MFKMGCPSCGFKDYRLITDWKPEKGYDSSMKKVVCLDCGVKYYIVPERVDKVPK